MTGTVVCVPDYKRVMTLGGSTPPLELGTSGESG